MRRLVLTLLLPLVAGCIVSDAEADTWRKPVENVYDENTLLAPSKGLGFAGAGVSCAYSSSSSRNICTIAGGDGHQIRDDGVAMTSRTGLNFTGSPFVLTDDSVGNETEVALSLADADIPNNITVDLAATATALAANPADCSANQFATAIAASGALTCAALADADIPGTLSARTFSGRITSSVASNGFSYSLLQGARLSFNGGTDTRYLTYNGSALVWNGNLEVANNLKVTGGSFFQSVSGRFEETSTGVPLRLMAARTDAAAAIAIKLWTQTDLTTDGAQLLTLGDVNENTYHFKVDKDGSPVFNFAGGGSQPTCNAAHRGYVWRTEGGAGVADKIEMCAKNAADAYAWMAL